MSKLKNCIFKCEIKLKIKNLTVLCQLLFVECHSPEDAFYVSTNLRLDFGNTKTVLSLVQICENYDEYLTITDHFIEVDMLLILNNRKVQW